MYRGSPLPGGASNAVVGEGATDLSAEGFAGGCTKGNFITPDNSAGRRLSLAGAPLLSSSNSPALHLIHINRGKGKNYKAEGVDLLSFLMIIASAFMKVMWHVYSESCSSSRHQTKQL